MIVPHACSNICLGRTIGETLRARRRAKPLWRVLGSGSMWIGSWQLRSRQCDVRDPRHTRRRPRSRRSGTSGLDGREIDGRPRSRRRVTLCARRPRCDVRDPRARRRPRRPGRSGGGAFGLHVRSVADLGLWRRKKGLPLEARGSSISWKKGLPFRGNSISWRKGLLLRGNETDSRFAATRL